ncbi:hypothetical protein T4B_3868 [Trichinella pseudospiralis]|uniref:Uncharacterized protein n=1 Tax=Trichinella pseudospiralis TaxID=6337 RepID=A0A0V1I605_TRIPS|nr:hypothetical protein T4B_3868 [Trichinella pseudospiralis]
MSSFSCFKVSRPNHSVLAFTAFNNCVSWVLATGQTFRFYLYGATIFCTPTSAKTLRRLFVHIAKDPSAWPFSAEQILDLHLFIQPADLTIPFSPSQHSTTVLVGYWPCGLPLSSVSNEQRLKIQCRLPFSCCGAYTFRTVPRSPQSVLIFQSVSSFDDGIPDNKEKSQQRNQMKCISERAIDSHVE